MPEENTRNAPTESPIALTTMAGPSLSALRIVDDGRACTCTRQQHGRWRLSQQL